MSQDKSSSSAEIPLITFNSLYNILREEKKSKTLQKLPELFYESMKQFFDNKRKEVQKLKNEEENKDRLKKERFVLSNAKKISDELMSIRCIKISNVAVKNCVFDDEILSRENILPEEEEFFSEVEKSVKRLKKRVS